MGTHVARDRTLDRLAIIVALEASFSCMFLVSFLEKTSRPA